MPELLFPLKSLNYSNRKLLQSISNRMKIIETNIDFALYEILSSNGGYIVKLENNHSLGSSLNFDYNNHFFHRMLKELN